ncbi:hypothetical protein MGU_02405 [Metarhizium guizhouense ARSEF 977]|uniref:Uncharacterized protein n=1 Tax=Metarhizium guizhouense (strain ARSEF 977) TaxID=1276136 RepID=A0A0B4H5P3_METGA|nr:hypothetical protein MGU_02405 [Metarhizium guizhouense ARSEF 977]
MHTGVNPMRSTDKNRTLHGEGTGEIRIALDRGPARHLRFPQPPGPPPTVPLPDPPTPWAKTTPEHAQGRTSQAQTIQEDSQGLVREVLVRKVLATEFDQVEGDLKVRINLYKSGGKRGIDKNTGRPYTTVVEALLKALERDRLSEEEENVVFKHLQWLFFCQNCKEDKPACEFDSCSREFWAIEPEEWVFLHGEKCMPCEEEEELSSLRNQDQSFKSIPSAGRGRA